MKTQGLNLFEAILILWAWLEKHVGIHNSCDSAFRDKDFDYIGSIVSSKRTIYLD